MDSGSIFNNNAIPAEYRKAAEKLFPANAAPGNKNPEIKAAEDFAFSLGIGTEYKRLFSLIKAPGKEMNEFMNQFQNNLDLLIQKTWVEKADETRKEKLLSEIPGFISDIEKRNFKNALDQFALILNELAYLLFGAQSTREDFTEYTFRIDEQMGLFWWYSAQLTRLKEAAKEVKKQDDESLWAVLLIGICYLTNF